MALFKKLLKSEKKETPQKDIPWIELTNVSQLNDLEEASYSKPQFIFKHSSRCHISSMVLRQFREDYNISAEMADLYFLDLIAYRDISNEIAARFNVIHESPQLIAIKSGKVVIHDSHGAINSMDLNELF